MLKIKLIQVNLVSSLLFVNKVKYKIVLKKNSITFLCFLEVKDMFIQINNITVSKNSVIPNYVITYRKGIKSNSIKKYFKRFDGFYNKLNEMVKLW